jgi:D-sedoheptulose 7-phosphate isomerase
MEGNEKYDNGYLVAALASAQQEIQESVAVQTELAERGAKEIVRAGAAILDCLRAGGKLMAFGNGGSAADAQHLAAELVGRYRAER